MSLRARRLFRVAQVTANPWVADLYEARAKQHDHPHAVHILARAWVIRR